MSVIDELKELDAKRDQLIKQAKEDALRKANEAIADLNALGFNYILAENSVPTGAPAVRQTRGRRRSGVRQEVLEVIKQHPEGIKPADIIEAMGMSDDKSGQNAIRNALTAMKKDGEVTAENSLYTAPTAPQNPTVPQQPT